VIGFVTIYVSSWRETHVRFGSKADMCGAQADVRFVPKAGIGTSITSSGCEQGWSRTIDGARA
jgi:hypothetical protein